MHVVTKREALALRRERERYLASALPERATSDPCPAEQTLRREHARTKAQALGRLKPDERRAIVLKAEGYSYAEIGAMNGWSYTKTNRCITEGRARLRQLASGMEP